MRYDVVITGPEAEYGLCTATAAAMGVQVARELRRDPARAKRAVLQLLAERADVTEIVISDVSIAETIKHIDAKWSGTMRALADGAKGSE